MRNRILCVSWIAALITAAICVAVIAESAECIPPVPCVIGGVSLAYVVLFYFVNAG